MNFCCDSLLNEFSCRFCLGEAENGTVLTGKTHFRCEKRIISSEQIFNLLNLRVISSPLVPNRICGECQSTIVAFYSLKKNFHDNEAVLLGKADEDSNQSGLEVVAAPKEAPVEGNIIPIVKEFLKENSNKCFNISKYTGKLLIETEEPVEGDEDVNVEKLKVVIYDRLADNNPPCTKCAEHSTQVEDTTKNFNINEESMESHEEYLEEVVDLVPEPVVDDNEDSYQSIPPDIQEFNCQEIKTEPIESIYSCQYCEKTFSSRSGRDTHQQLKHKCPDDFDPINYVCHEQEIEADGKPCLVWRCPICSHFSKKKDHHRTHMIRHAIRDKEDQVKLEIESSFVLENEDSQEDKMIFAAGEKSIENIENFLSPVVHDKTDACQLLVITEENLFCCTVCRSKFPNEEAGKFHVQKFGTTSLCISCICTDCNVIFPSKKLLKRHQDLHVLNGIAHCLNYFECLTCSVVFSNQKDLDAHLKLHVRLPKDGNEVYQYQAEYNTKLDGCELQLESFQEEWMGTGQLRCGHCSKIASREAMNLHVTFFHASLKCPFDNQEFSRSLGYFVEHLKSKHPGEFKGVTVSFKCPFCKDDFATLTAMKIHCKTCQEKRIDCSHCDKKFFTERQLKLHLSLVSGAKNFKCATCEKTFSNKTELTVHSRMHSNEKPYLCTFPNCDKAFRTNSHRSSHMDTHSSSENYQCSHCEIRFKTRGARRIHEKTHTGSEKSACNICRREFRQRSHMIRHVKVVHGIKCTSANVDQVIGTQIQKVESSTIDESSMEFSS